MRIAFYSPQTSHLKPGLERGGDPIFLRDLFAELRQRGHEIEVISDLNVRRLWKGDVPARSIVSEAIAVRRRVKRFRPEAWLVYNPSASHPDLFGWWQRPKRYVLLAASRHQSKRMPRGWRSFLSWSHRRSLRRADFVTTLKPSSLERLVRYGVERDKSGLLFTAVPTPGPIPSQEEARASLGLPLDVPIVLCISRFTVPNGGQGKTRMILDLLSVVPSLPPDVLVVIVGDGPGRSMIETAARRLELGERVRLTGAVEHADVGAYFAACDVYSQPHPLDGPWLSVLEAQAHGRPVVTMRTHSGELTVDEGRSGLLADTMDEFADHLAALTSDRARCASMGRAAGQFIADFHSIDVRVRQIEELLDGRESHSPRPAPVTI